MKKEELGKNLLRKIQKETGLTTKELLDKRIRVEKIEEDIITFDGYIMTFRLESDYNEQTGT